MCDRCGVAFQAVPIGPPCLLPPLRPDVPPFCVDLARSRSPRDAPLLPSRPNRQAQASSSDSPYLRFGSLAMLLASTGPNSIENVAFSVPISGFL